MDAFNAELSQWIARLQGLTRVQWVGVYLGLLVVVSGAFYLLDWRGRYEVLAQQDTQINDAVGRLESKSSLSLQQPQIELRLAQLRVRLPLLQQSLPDSDEVALFLKKLNATIQSNNLGLTEFVPQASNNLDVMRIVPVSLVVNGRGAPMSLLPNHVARLSRQANFEEFQLNLEDDHTRWKLSGKLFAYAQLEESPPGSVTSQEAPKP